MKTYLILAIAALFAIVPASARLGETRKQCLERYGKPIHEEGRTLVFQKNGYRIFVELLDNKAEGLSIRKVEEDGVGNPLPLSVKELDLILTANSSGKEWKRVRSQTVGQAWKREGAQADYRSLKRTLSLFTDDLLAKLGEESDERAEKDLEGF